VNTEGFALSILLHACLMANIDSTSSHNVSDHGTYLFISETSCDDARAGTVFGEADGGSAAAAPVSEVCPSDGPNANTTGAQRGHPVADSSVADAPVADELPTGNLRFCPMCGTCDHDLLKTAGRRTILLAAALDALTKGQFERAFDSDKPFNIPFKLCRSCNNKVDAAIKKVEEETPPLFPDVCPAAGGTTGKKGKNAVKLGLAAWRVGLIGADFGQAAAHGAPQGYQATHQQCPRAWQGHGTAPWRLFPRRRRRWRCLGGSRSTRSGVAC